MNETSLHSEFLQLLLLSDPLLVMIMQISDEALPWVLQALDTSCNAVNAQLQFMFPECTSVKPAGWLPLGKENLAN